MRFRRFEDKTEHKEINKQAAMKGNCSKSMTKRLKGGNIAFSDVYGVWVQTGINKKKEALPIIRSNLAFTTINSPITFEHLKIRHCIILNDSEKVLLNDLSQG